MTTSSKDRRGLVPELFLSPLSRLRALLGRLAEAGRPGMPMTSKDRRRLVQNLFRGLLFRDPEQGATEHWMAQLKGWTDVNPVFEQFLDTEEHRRLRSAANALWVPPGHFYSPIVNVEEVRAAFSEDRPTPEQVPGIAIDRSAMLALWQRLLPHLTDTPFPATRTDGFRYYFENTAFSYGDGSILSAMLRLFRPSRLVEIGSGYSSVCALDTIDRYLGGNVETTFLDPHPELLVDLLGKDAPGSIKVLGIGAQHADISLFTQLTAGDFLFIDSTHVMKTGSDVCRELFEILPAVQPGVLIHFHDVFWPFEYPSDWVLRENRSWNELYGLRAFLMGNAGYEVVFFNDYFAKHCHEVVIADYPIMLKNSGGSLWLRKR